VIFKSTLNSWLTKVRPGNVQSEDADGLLRLGPTFSHSGRYPFPFTKTLSSAQVLTQEDIQGSFTATRIDTQGVALNLAPWVDLPPGVWDIDLEYSQVLGGAVSDLTCVSDLSLNIVDGGITRNHLIARLHGGQQQFQRYHRFFTITVTKEIRTFFGLQHTVGLGTAQNVARASLMAYKIL